MEDLAKSLQALYAHDTAQFYDVTTVDTALTNSIETHETISTCKDAQSVCNTGTADEANDTSQSNYFLAFTFIILMMLQLPIVGFLYPGDVKHTFL